ncbi:hypothetical protein PGB90_001795 [Kerria lacca]
MLFLGIAQVPNDTTDFNLLWTGLHIKPQILRNLLPHQRLNHFPRSYELTRKDRLYKNIEQMQHARGLKHFDFVPQTFVLPTEINELITSHYRHRGAWIIKPIASSRGRGIYIVNSVEDIPLQENVIVAKYIENPLLVNGRKCDLRLYVVVTSYNPLLVYLYEEGMVRFATVKYDLKEKNLWNPCMHLCNYSINKHHSDYIKSSDPEADDIGHKWSLSALLKHLKSENNDTSLLMRRIEDMIIKAILATAPSIVTACRLFVPYPANCFELYGFDVLIDSDLKPWLLEVNLSPSLGCDSPLDTRLKSAMLSDLLTLIGIPLVDPMTRPKSSNFQKRNLALAKQILSVNTLPYIRNSKGKTSKQSSTLTADEVKMMRSIRDQFDRKGGFVRIFPTTDSWKKYSKYLDSVTGIPTCGTIQYSGQILTPNYNKTVHSHLYSNLLLLNRSSFESNMFPVVSKSFDRMLRYERSLSNQYRKELEMDITGDEVVQNSVSISQKQIIIKYLRNGSEFNQFQAQALFGAYLQKVLHRLKTTEIKYEKVTIADKEMQCDVVLQFLHMISQNLTMPLQFKKPSKNLRGNDKIAITAKHLSDFLFFYVQESKCTINSENDTNFISEDIFTSFLKIASESDIEDVLNLNLKLRITEIRPSKNSRLSKLSLFQVFKRAENCVLSKVTN